MVRRKNAEPIDWPCEGPALDDFVTSMLARGDELYRDLPWRHVDDPYAVLVSEIMLQQTQVARVGRFWERFLSAFPTVDALAAAAVPDVLELWQGLGYNRRALALKRTADRCAAEGAGRLPETYEGLLALPGIGPATAAGVVAFAYQRPAVYLETNVRSVFLHELFPEEEAVSDKVLLPLVEAAAFHPAAGSRSAPLVLRPARLRRASEGHGAESLPAQRRSQPPVGFRGLPPPEAGLDHPPRARRSRGRLPRGRARRPEHGRGSLPVVPRWSLRSSIPSSPTSSPRASSARKTIR